MYTCNVQDHCHGNQWLAAGRGDRVRTESGSRLNEIGRDRLLGGTTEERHLRTSHSAGTSLCSDDRHNNPIPASFQRAITDSTQQPAHTQQHNTDPADESHSCCIAPVPRPAVHLALSVEYRPTPSLSCSSSRAAAAESTGVAASSHSCLLEQLLVHQPAALPLC